MGENTDKMEKELGNLLNKYSMDNKCNTPDYILSNYLMGCLIAFKATTDNRDNWNKDNITIPKKEYKELVIDSIKLQRLKMGGVDDWLWYSDSLNPEGYLSMDEIENEISRGIYDCY